MMTGYGSSSSQQYTWQSNAGTVEVVHLMFFIFFFFFFLTSRRRSANSFSTSPESTEAPSGVCAEVRVPSTALHVFVSMNGSDQDIISLPLYDINHSFKPTSKFVDVCMYMYLSLETSQRGRFNGKA